MEKQHHGGFGANRKVISRWKKTPEKEQRGSGRPYPRSTVPCASGHRRAPQDHCVHQNSARRTSALGRRRSSPSWMRTVLENTFRDLDSNHREHHHKTQALLPEIGKGLPRSQHTASQDHVRNGQRCVTHLDLLTSVISSPIRRRLTDGSETTSTVPWTSNPVYVTLHYKRRSSKNMKDFYAGSNPSIRRDTQMAVCNAVRTWGL